MLFKRRGRHADFCILRVSPEVLELPRVVVTDANASSPYVRFAAAPEGLAIVNRELTFAEYWTDSDPIAYYRRKSAKCAEVLVPDVVASRFLMGAYVSWDDSLARWSEMGIGIPASVNRDLFFL